MADFSTKPCGYRWLKIIKYGENMQTTLNMAERKKKLKVIGFHKSMGAYGKGLLARMGIKEGVKLEIDAAYVSQIVLQLKGKKIQLGYDTLLSVVAGDKRLTDFQPKELGTISALEVGRGALAKYRALGLKVGTTVEVVKFTPDSGPLFVKIQDAHIAISNVEGFVINDDELYEYDLPGELVFVKVNKTEKQLSRLKPGEEGTISSIAGNAEIIAKLDQHWIKPGYTVKALHRQDTESHPLMVTVKGNCHHIPKGLTEKIYVKIT